MKIQDKATFDKANVFGLGQENTAFCPVFYWKLLFKSPDKAGKKALYFWQMSHLNQAAAITGISITQKPEADRS